MRSRNLKKAMYVALVGGTLFGAGTAGCGASIGSLLADLAINALFSIALSALTT